ncbi:MAG: hypothetical protein PVS2B2_15860 [Candidatus Acidiferrum sp.]
MLKGYPVKEFHGDKCVAFVVADIVKSANVGVVQSGSGLGFPLEASQSLSVPGEIIGKEFQRNESVETGVFGLIDDAHAAAAKLLNDAVVRYGLAE